LSLRLQWRRVLGHVHAGDHAVHRSAAAGVRRVGKLEQCRPFLLVRVQRGRVLRRMHAGRDAVLEQRRRDVQRERDVGDVGSLYEPDVRRRGVQR
jgi:hypothetical protein